MKVKFVYEQEDGTHIHSMRSMGYIPSEGDLVGFQGDKIFGGKAGTVEKVLWVLGPSADQHVVVRLRDLVPLVR